MRGQTNHVGGGLMAFSAIAFAALFTLASASDKTLEHFWHRWWFISLVVFFGVMAVAGLWIVLAGSLPWVPPLRWTSENSIQPVWSAYYEGGKGGEGSPTGAGGGAGGAAFGGIGGKGGDAPAMVQVQGGSNWTFERNIIVGDAPFLDATDTENVRLEGNVRIPTAAFTDSRPISVKIDRTVEWRNFRHKAWIFLVHLVVVNQTDVSKEIQSINRHGPRAWNTVGDPELLRERSRLERERPELRRHAILEPGVPESGWHVGFADWTPSGIPPEDDLAIFVQVEGVEYEAIR